MESKYANVNSSQVFSDASVEVPIPEGVALPNAALIYWEAITTSRAKSTWTKIDLYQAANLARLYLHIERLQQELDECPEYSTLKSANGGETVHPNWTLLKSLLSQSVALSRFLQVHAIATVGESKQSRGKNKAQRDAEAAMRKTSRPGLIATPGGVKH